MIIKDAYVLSNECISQGIYKMRLGGEFNALPGQFINIKLNDSKLLLRRPISVYDCKKDYVEIIYRVVGEGTKELSNAQIGDKFNVLGPVGSSFPLNMNRRILLVGGGIGVPPLHYLAKNLYKNNEITFVIGFRDKSQIILKEELEKYGKVIITTDDGSYGYHGNVLKAIEEYNIDFDVVYACGPSKMLQFLDEKYQNVKEGYISFEERMACGVGICYGCACKPKKLEKGMLRVCKEGPVFELGVISYE